MAQAIHYNERMRDRKWEEGNDISVLEFAATGIRKNKPRDRERRSEEQHSGN
jgi:hypothetical protein